MTATDTATKPDHESGEHRPVDSFGIMLTEQWNIVPIDRSDFEKYRNDLLAKMAELDEWSKTDNRKLDMVLQKVRNDLLGQQTRFAALFFDMGVPEGQDVTEDNLEPVVAAVTFSTHTQADFKTELKLTPQVLFAAFAVRRASTQTDTQRVTDLEPPRLTELPVGQCVHVRRLVEPTKALDQTPPFFSETFVIPMGVDNDACGILQFVTPNVLESQQFSLMFNQLANTATLFADGDDTTFNNTHPGR